MYLKSLLSSLLVVIVAAPMLCAADELAGAAQLKDHLTLADCLEVALDSNFEIRRAKERINREQGVVVEARAAFLPRLSINGNLNRVDEGLLDSFNGTTFGDDTSWTVQAEISETIFASGRNLATLEGARQRRDAARAEFTAVVNDQLLNVKERFFDLLLAKKRVEVQEQSLKLLEEELKSERLKNKAGSVSDYNVLRAEVAVANARPPLIRSKNQVTIAEHELRRALGIKVESSRLTVTGPLVYEPLSMALETALEDAVKARPELLRLKSQLKSQEYVTKATSRGNLPTVEIYGTYGAEKSRFSSDFNENIHGWGAGVRGTWNLFDGMATQGREAAAEAERASLAHSLEEQYLLVDLEVRQAHASFQDASSLVAASLKVAEQARESLRLARSRLSVGAGTQLEVLDGEVALTEARTNEVEALHAYNVAVARLQRAIGRN